MLQATKQQTDPTCPISGAIVFIARPNIRPAIRQELKGIGVHEIYNAESLETCIELLKRLPTALLILDGEHDVVVVNSALRHAQAPIKAETRSILFITPEISSTILATSAEYCVSRLLTGEVSRTNLQNRLEEIISDEWQAIRLKPSFKRVAAARQQQDYVTVTNILLTLRQQAPQDMRLTCELADSLIQRKKWAEAKAILDELGGDTSRHLRAKHLYARCLMQEGRFTDAVAILEGTRLINPHHVDRLVDLGVALLNCDRLPEAAAIFDQALVIDPDAFAAKKGLAECRLLEGEINEALELMRQVSGPRELASIFNNAAVLSIRAERFEAGFKLYQSALRLLGHSESAAASVLFNLGVACHKRDRTSEALQYFEKALALNNQLDKARHNATIIAGMLRKSPAVDATSHMVEEFEDETLHLGKT